MQDKNNEQQQPLDPTAQEAAEIWTAVVAYARRKGVLNLARAVVKGLVAQRIDHRGRLVLGPARHGDRRVLGCRDTIESWVLNSGAAAGLVLTNLGPGLSIEPKPLHEPKTSRQGGLQLVADIMSESSGVPIVVGSKQEALLTQPVDLGFLHSVFTQTFLPRSQPRDGGKFTREWVMRSGGLSLTVTGGRIVQEGKPDILVPIPYGPKARHVLIDICTYALKNQTPTVHMERSLRQYAQRLGIAPPQSGGRQARLLRNQVIALAACHMVWQWDGGDKVQRFNGTPMRDFEAWPDPDGQMALWPSTIRLDTRFFASLLKHGVPLNLHAVRALGGSSLALDWLVYLVHRLRRIQPGQPVDLSWQVLREQMAPEWTNANFKKRSTRTIKEKVMPVYPGLMHALEAVPGGLRMKHCPPPVQERGLLGERRLA